MGLEISVKRNPDATRQKILDAAFTEIHRNGFRNASIDQIVSETGLTKGALYHHFPTKAELGYAVIEEAIRGVILTRWIEPLQSAEDPIDGIRRVLQSFPEDDIDLACECGCPLNNLAQEMSSVDETFRHKLQTVYREWRDRTAEALFRGQGAGYVSPDVDCRKAATFIVSSVEGAAGTAKNGQDPAALRACFEGIIRYLESLRAPVHAEAS